MLNKELWHTEDHMFVALLSVFAAQPAIISVPEIAWQDFGHFIQPGNLIGSGTFGDVYRGQWQGLDIAIKKLRLQVLDIQAIKDFNNETQLMWQCQFQNVLKLHGVCTEPNHYAMIFELMPQGSLYDLLRHSTEIEERHRWKVAIDIAQGLFDLHSRHILHRDLKSLNVLLDEHCQAKLSDFGLAKLRLATSTTTTAHRIVGTMRWNAPELLLFEGDTPPPSTNAMDIYSYGVILWELAARREPFKGLQDAQILMKIQQGKRDSIPTDCHPIWKEIIEACWQQDPQRRPSAKQVLDRLKEAQPKPPRPVWLWAEDPDPSEIDTHGLFPAGQEDWKKVISYYRYRPVPGYDIGSVLVIYNPSKNQGFVAKMDALQQRKNNPRYVPTWRQKTDADWRIAIDQQLKQFAAHYQNDDYPDVKLIPVWHGTQRQKLASLLSTGS